MERLDKTVNRRVDSSNRGTTTVPFFDQASRYQAIFDAVPTAICVCDHEGAVQDYNARAAELWGREPTRGDPNERYCGALRIFDPDGRLLPHSASPVADVIRTGEPLYNIKLVIERPDQSRIAVRMSCTPLRESGELNGVVISFDDIGEFDQVHKELRQSDDRYRHLVETSPYGIGVHRNGQLLYCNAHALQMLRARTFKELSGRSMFEFVHPDDRAAVVARIKSILADGVVVDPVVIRLLTFDRTEVSVEVIGRAVLFQGLPAVQTVMRDVTETHKALTALAASEERFRSLAEQTADGIFLADAQGRYIDFNPAGCEMLGYTHEELCRLAIVDIVAPSEIERVEFDIQSWHRGEFVRREWLFRRKDGSTFRGEIRGKALPDSRVLGCLRDMIKHKAISLLAKPYDPIDLLRAVEQGLAASIERWRPQQSEQSVQHRLATLTDEERKVLSHMMAGKANKFVAQALEISMRTLDRRRQSVLKKMDANSVPELALMLGGLSADETQTPRD